MLERRPLVTPNGFESNFVPVGAKFTKKRSAAREKILSVASSLTGKNFNDDTFVLITSGRCEYTNKGIDMFLEAVARVRDYNPKKTYWHLLWCRLGSRSRVPTCLCACLEKVGAVRWPTL